MISEQWSGRTLGSLALLLVAVVVVTLWLRAVGAGGPVGGWVLIAVGCGAIGALVATVQTMLSREDRERTKPPLGS